MQTQLSCVFERKKKDLSKQALHVHIYMYIAWNMAMSKPKGLFASQVLQKLNSLKLVVVSVKHYLFHSTNLGDKKNWFPVNSKFHILANLTPRCFYQNQCMLQLFHWPRISHFYWFTYLALLWQLQLVCKMIDFVPFFGGYNETSSTTTNPNTLMNKQI
jgi:hypothetical protein